MSLRRSIIIISCGLTILSSIIEVSNAQLPVDNNNGTENEKMSRIDFLDDQRIRPNVSGGPVKVKLSVYILSLGPCEDLSMECDITLYLRMQWFDSREVFNGLKYVILRGDDTDVFWKPDVFFVNEKRATIPDVTIKNMAARIYPAGYIFFSVRVSLRVTCQMHLALFPMDTQTCFVAVESYAYPTSDLVLEWDAVAVDTHKDLKVSHFILSRLWSDVELQNYTTGFFSTAYLRFEITRELLSYMITSYVPSALLVMISWLSFWIDIRATPARATLAVTCLLTMSHIALESDSFAKFQTITAMDVWMATCLCFVFGAMMEFATASYTLTKPKTIKPKKGDTSASLEENENSKSRPSTVTSSSSTANSMDTCSRVLFPTVFLIFNICYWVLYQFATVKNA
ncbi:glycine receptor subunit alphaZ1-like isoform X1 [Anneissia japonica]|uniref:glycine receptor subunit alphaZ1-like isoform X1 n=1 Tax=Anneissia japonica TaxID=1529436 RepID=UPI001425B40C|nr:glycine receptor subunit alphaZ1-like isoform X1 [Anneissia japonica]